MGGARSRGVAAVAAVVVMAASAAGAQAATRLTDGYSVGAISDVSSSCSGQNAEVEQGVDRTRGYVYEAWIGCKGIGFARSTNGGGRFGTPISIRGSSGAWDPAVAVGPDGTVYVAFMVTKGSQELPVVAASFDHGATFPQQTSLTPPQKGNWGDRDFIAVGPDGSVYVTWDYGPSAATVTFICTSGGSCSFATGQLNAVIQRSTNGARSFGPMSYVSPGFPGSGADSAPLVIEPSGRIDVLYQGYQVTDPKTYALGNAYSYFTSSSDHGSTWSTPVTVGASAGTMSASEWWIDGDVGIDAGGNLYATWDTQGNGSDVGWLSYSTDGGRHWSAPIQAPADQLNVPHIVEVAGGASGTAYVGWLSNSNPLGYAQYLRAFSIGRGWLSPPQQISTAFGDATVWPGDTFGISSVEANRLVLSWGSATPASRKDSEIFAAPVTATFASP